MTPAFGEPVTVHSRTLGPPDSNGNDTWIDADVSHAGVILYPRETVELVQKQDLNIIGLVAVFRPAVTINATDEISARGQRWTVDGLPGQYANPYTGTTVTKVNLTRAEG